MEESSRFSIIFSKLGEAEKENNDTFQTISEVREMSKEIRILNQIINDIKEGEKFTLTRA